MKQWERYLSETDIALYRTCNYDQRRLSFGQRPVLLVIDMTVPFVGSRPQPRLKAVQEYATSCGQEAWDAVENIGRLLGACRARAIPVVFTTSDAEIGRFTWGATKRSAPTGAAQPDMERIVEPLLPSPSEIVIRKSRASAFFGTSLLGCLQAVKADTLLVTGCTTSGCVRASVVDGLSFGYPCFVVEECTFDRFEFSHWASLFDMHAKYAEVIGLDEATDYVNGMKHG